MKRNNTLTSEQAVIVKEYCDVYGLSPEQVTFDGNDTKPIFDHNAISVLSLRITDIADIEILHTENTADGIGVFGSVVLPDGRKRGCVGAASFAETLPNGKKVDTASVALGVATSRCFRMGLRNVGIDLHASHRHFVRTGEILSSHTNRDPRASVYAEIHILATELDLIIDGDKAKYREYLAENYDGRVSARDLDDLELQRLISSFRSLTRLRREKAAA